MRAERNNGRQGVGGQRKRKSRLARNLAVALVLTGGGAGAYVYHGQNQAKMAAETESGVYRTETVKYGSVTSGIEESGTIAFGSKEQNFTVAEATDTSSSGSSSTGSADTSASSMNMAGGSASSVSGQSLAGNASSEDAASVQNAVQSTSSSSESASLEVEEVYVTAGQVVKEGDALLKITEDSIETYRAALEAAVKSARLAVSQEEIHVESKKAEAEYTYNIYLAEGEAAEAAYQATITGLENEVAELEEELQESSEAVAEYEEELAAGYDVDDELEEEELNYSTIEANLQVAKNNLATQSIEAKQTYENAMTNYKYADQLYEIDTDGLEDDLEDAKEALEEAENALADFEEQIGDGVIYSEYSGTVTSVGYAAGDALGSGSAVAEFLDSEDVTMTVSVSQEDISNIATGNAVSVSLTAYPDETFAGQVSSIATSSTMGSSTVNYDVKVTLTGDTGKIYADMTGEVTFVEKEETDVLYISNKAVRQDGTRTWVKVLNDDGTTQEITVETGFSNGSKVAVVSGLSEGQTVVIESQVTAA